ncbi:MAG: PKD domain-containing protein [bacterium]|nr:PKD domain-containing protein [bacterium]
MHTKMLFSNLLSFSFAFILIPFVILSQNQTRNWYFGNGAGLTFASATPTLTSGGAITTSLGCAAISDVAGNLLFYTDGVTVYNQTHSVMANGTGLHGTNAFQPALILKQPAMPNIYYVFTVGGWNTANGLKYSIVDMSLAAGLGSVTVKNFSLYAPTCDKQVAVRHCNGKDVWIISHEYHSDKFRSYLLTSAGLSSSPVISAVGETITLPATASSGEMKISPDGKKLAVATASSSSPPGIGLGGFFLFDFDASTGVVSNSLALLNFNPTYGRAIGMEFSPDGTKLYGSSTTSTNPPVSWLYQWNVCAPTAPAIIASLYSFSVQNTFNVAFGGMQKGIDGKVYLSVSGQQSLGVINNPNSSGAAMNFVLNGQSVAPNICGFGLPNFINSYLKPIPSIFSNSISCQNVNFSVPPLPTFSSGCQSSPYPTLGYIWNFGDPSSGAANSSTLTSPVHFYSSLGTYSVSLILLNPCSNDTVTKTVTVAVAGPSPAISGNTLICKGEKNTYSVTGGSTYSWSTGGGTSTVALTPTQTTVFSASATTNGCTLSKSYTVTVNPCTGLNADEEYKVQIFPNPVSRLLNIEVEDPAQLRIFDLNGIIILQQSLKPGTNSIDLLLLAPTVYIVEIGNWRGRVIKINSN